MEAQMRAEPSGLHQVECHPHPPHSCSLLPPLSPASANICNVVLMRYGELEEGIDVLDGDGNLVGSSKIAARHVGPLRLGGWRGTATGRLVVSPKCFHFSKAVVRSALALSS